MKDTDFIFFGDIYIYIYLSTHIHTHIYTHTHFYIYIYISLSLSLSPIVAMVDHKNGIKLFLIFEELLFVFHMALLVNIPTNSVQRFPFSHTLTNTYLLSF